MTKSSLAGQLSVASPYVKLIGSANLGRSYFTNRQDRYIHFRSHPSLLSYLSSLTRLFTQYSYLLSPSPPPSISRHHLVPLPQPPGSSKFFGTASLVWPTPSIHPRAFSQHALATLSAFQKSWKASNASRLRRVDVDTYFWPVIQAGVLGVKEEEAALARVWQAVKGAHENEDERVGVDLTSGYFGLYKAYKKAVIDSPAPFRVITASPKVSGTMPPCCSTAEDLGEWFLWFCRIVTSDTGGLYVSGTQILDGSSSSWSGVSVQIRYRCSVESMGKGRVDISFQGWVLQGS